jgi:biopolymer transport protein ExbB
VLAIIEAAGWPIWPIIAASVIALGIIGERIWTLRAGSVAPQGLLENTLREYAASGVSPEWLQRLSDGSVLGRVFAAGLRNETSSREVMKEAIEEAGRGAAHELGRFLSGLGTIASLAPIMGLLGTVIGMIEIFGSQGPTGASPAQLAHGISVALYNTAFGLIVAIPSMIFYRYFRARVDSLVVEMEQQAVKLVEMLHGDRR